MYLDRSQDCSLRDCNLNRNYIGHIIYLLLASLVLLSKVDGFHILYSQRDRILGIMANSL